MYKAKILNINHYPFLLTLCFEYFPIPKTAFTTPKKGRGELSLDYRITLFRFGIDGNLSLYNYFAEGQGG